MCCWLSSAWKINGSEAGVKLGQDMKVNFQGLHFTKTSLIAFDSSLKIEDCVFNRSESSSVNITNSVKGNFSTSVIDSTFIENNGCFHLTSSQYGSPKSVFNNVTFERNSRHNRSLVILLSMEFQKTKLKFSLTT